MRKRAPQQLLRLQSGPIQQGIAAEAANLLQIVRTASQSEGWGLGGNVQDRMTSKYTLNYFSSFFQLDLELQDVAHL